MNALCSQHLRDPGAVGGHHYLAVALQIGHRHQRISQMREKTVDSGRSHHRFKVAMRHPGKYPAGIIEICALF